MKCVVKNNSSMDMGPLLPLLKSLLPYTRKKLGFNRPPSLFFASDTENASKPLGKTAFYDPSEASITIFVDGRHPKDILRSISHELVHHMQHERGDFGTDMDTGEGYAQKNDALRELEREAYESGNMCFRDWEDENRQALQEAKQHFDRKNKKMSANDKRNDKIESLLMEKWGFKAKAPNRKLLKEQFSASSEPLTDEEKSKLTSIEDLEAMGVQLPVIGDGDGTNREMVTIDADVADDVAAAEDIVTARQEAKAAAAAAEAKRLEDTMTTADVEIDPYYGREPEIEVEPVEVSTLEDLDAAVAERYSNMDALNSGLSDLKGGKIVHNTRDSKILARAVIFHAREESAGRSQLQPGMPVDQGVTALLNSMASSTDDQMRQFLLSGIESHEILPITAGKTSYDEKDEGAERPRTRSEMKSDWVFNARDDEGNYYINSAEDIIAIMSGRTTDNIEGLVGLYDRTAASASNLQDKMMLGYNLTTRNPMNKGEHDGIVRKRENQREGVVAKAKVNQEIKELKDKIDVDGYTLEQWETEARAKVATYKENYPTESTFNASGAAVLEVPGVGFWGETANFFTGVDQNRLPGSRDFVDEDPDGTKRVAHELIELEADRIEETVKIDSSIKENIDKAEITKEFNKIVENEKIQELENAKEISMMLKNGFIRNRTASRTGEDIFRPGRVKLGGGEGVFEEVLSLDGFAEVLLPPGLDAESMKVFRSLKEDFTQKWNAGQFQSIEDIQEWAQWGLGQPQKGEDGVTRDWRGINTGLENYDRIRKGYDTGPSSTGRRVYGRPRHSSYLGGSYSEGDMGITAMGVAEAHIFRDPEQSKRQQYFELKRKNIQRVVKLARDRVLAREEKIFAGDDGARIAVGGRREDNIREALIRKVVQEALKRKFGE